MIAVDASVAVAAFGDWHRGNPEACAVLDEGAALPAHALLETDSVLTGFPTPPPVHSGRSSRLPGSTHGRSVSWRRRSSPVRWPPRGSRARLPPSTTWTSDRDFRKFDGSR